MQGSKFLIWLSFFGLLALTACKKKEDHPVIPAISPGEHLETPVNSHPPKIGDIVPDFTLKDRSGASFKLSQFRGNLIFLNFWATWCPPCVEEIPAMEVLNQKLKAKNFMMIAVSVDENWDRVDTFLKMLSHSPSFLILLDETKQLTTEVYGTTKFPETYVIDTDGRLLKKYAGAYNWVDPKHLQDFEALLSKKVK